MKQFGQWLLAVLIAIFTLFVAVFSLPWFYLHRRYGLRVLIGWDQLVNTYAAGYPDEMISARAFRSRWIWRQRLINSLFFLLVRQKDHCAEAYIKELERSQLPLDYHKPQ